MNAVSKKSSLCRLFGASPHVNATFIKVFVCGREGRNALKIMLSACDLLENRHRKAREKKAETSGTPCPGKQKKKMSK